MSAIDIKGQKYGKLRAIALSYSDHQGTHWKFKCECGNECVARLKDVRYGNTASCGCAKLRTRENIKKPVKVARPWNK